MITIDLKKIRKPFKEIGRFRPNSDQNDWKQEFSIWLREHTFPGFRYERIDFRTSLAADTHYSTNYPVNDIAVLWHHDCNDRSPWILVWSDYRPTQIAVCPCEDQLDECEYTTLAPFRIYLVNNHKCWHRAQQVNGDTHERRFVVVRLYPNAPKKGKSK